MLNLKPDVERNGQIIKSNPYKLFASSGSPYIFLQGGQFYAEGGAQIDITQNQYGWVLEQVKRVVQKNPKALDSYGGVPKGVLK